MPSRRRDTQVSLRDGLPEWRTLQPLARRDRDLSRLTALVHSAEGSPHDVRGST